MNTSRRNYTEAAVLDPTSLKVQYAAEQVIWALILTANVYLVLVLFSYELREGRKTTDSRTPPNKVKRRRKFGKVAYFFGGNPMCILAAGFSFLRCAALQIELSFGKGSPAVCSAYQYLYTGLNNCNILAVYLMLWARQWLLYKNVAFKHIFTTPLKIFNISVLVGLFVSMAAITGLVYSGLVLKDSPKGCVYVREPAMGSLQFAIIGASFFGTVFIQISLLGLILYPLKRQYGLCCNHSNDVINDEQRQESGRIKIVAKRLSVSAAVCVISDLTIGLGVAAVDALLHDRIIVTWLCYNFNMTLSTYAIVCSFKNWRARLLPCGLHKQDKVSARRKDDNLSREGSNNFALNEHQSTALPE